jgi:para-aminobenzoate synthetase/4-amino-4-deoxychorismate lyase
MMPVRLRFDFVDAAGRQTPMVFERPRQVIEALRLEDVRPAMAEAEAARARGHWVGGFVAYEAAAAFDPALTTRTPGNLPLVWFGVFDAPSTPSPDGSPAGPAPATAGAPTVDWTADVTREEYDAAIARVRDAIQAGDSYQTNYTFRLRSRLDVASLAGRYDALRRAQRAPYAAHLDIGRWQILSLSPELFFRLDGRTVTTRPMKGTIARGRFPEEDAGRAATLQASTKNRAENVMIVDLMRNDVGRMAEVGSIVVPALFEIERYPSVFQMTSTITGRVRPAAAVTDLFTALFPAGSITGAPKTSSMRLITEIERAPRGVYCGAVGVLAPDGDAVFNVAIRTAVVDTTTGEVEYGVGGGITWDSLPGDEYAEALSKAGFLDAPPVFSLLETMRLEGGGVIRLERHLRRLERSAGYFGIPFDAAHVTSVLDEHLREHPGGSRRARLLLAPHGVATVDSEPFTPGAAGAPPVPVALARSPVSSQDRFLFHKTTHRAIYDRQRAASESVFDVLLWNERGEITEFTIGNVVVELDGRRYTPPVDCGLLAGTFREELLDAGAVAERVIKIGDLKRASRVWLVNSLREWVATRVGAAGSGDRLV